MPPKLTAQLQRWGKSISAMTLGQKVVAVIGIAVLALGGTAFGKWATTPTYVPAFSSLSASDANAISTELTKDKIVNQVGDGGSSILVPTADVAQARLKAAAAGLPADAATGYSLLDTNSGITSSQFQQKVTYQRALEGELQKTIEGITGVNAAVVHLAIPEETVYTDSAGKPTASVLVSTNAGTTLTDDQVQAIVHLVSSSVPNMDADQVTVSDSKGDLLSAAGQGVTGGASGDEQTADYEQSTAAKVQAMLDRVLGPGKALASVNATLDYDKTQRVTQTFSQTQGVAPLSSTTSKETYTGAAAGSAGGTLGLDNSTSTTTTTGTSSGTGSGYTKESSTDDNAINKVTEKTDVATGGVTRQSVAVVVDSAALKNIGLPQLQQMVTDAAGVDATRGDSISVTQASFDDSAAKTAAAQLAQEKAATAAAAQSKLIKQGIIGGLVLVAMVLVFLAWRRATKGATRESVDLGELERLYPPTGPVVPHDAMALESGLVPAAPDPAALRRAEVGELIDAQPDEVADLLRGWLTETKKG